MIELAEQDDLSAADEASKSPGKSIWLHLLDDIALACLLPSFVALTARWWWISDLCCHFVVPYILVLAPLLVVYLLLRRWRWAVVVGLALGYHVAALIPLYVPQTEIPEGERLRLMVANVYVGSHEPGPLLSLIEEESPDVLLLIEVNQRWMSDLQELEEAYPHRILAIRDDNNADFGAFGIALFSRLPLKKASSPRLGVAKIPAVMAEVEHAGRTWAIIGAHPYPPISSAYSHARNSLLSDLATLAAQTERPIVVLGDLNITRWSPYFSHLLSKSGLEDSSNGFGYQPTWPNFLPVPMIPIDHVLVSSDVGVVDRHISPPIGSDHRAVFVDVTRPESARH